MCVRACLCVCVCVKGSVGLARPRGVSRDKADASARKSLRHYRE